MKNSEKLLILAIVSVLLLVVNLPLLYFTLIGKSGLVFLGRRVVNSQDTYTYLSFIEQGRQGKWVFENLFTTEPQTASIIRPTYLLIGKFAALTHIPSIVAYHLMRLVSSIGLCTVLILVLRDVFPRPRQRLAALFLILSASGIGWLVGQFVPTSSDLWIPESNVFMSLAESPHFIVAQMMMVLGFSLFLRFVKTKQRRYAIGTIILCLFLAFDHPFDLVIMAPVLFVTGILSGLSLGSTVVVSVLSTIGILYPLIELRFNPVFASEQAQGISFSPSPLAFVCGLGLLLPLCVFGVQRLHMDNRPIVKLLLVWFVIGILLIYAPFSFQRRLTEGISIPVGIFASAGLIELYSQVRAKRKKLAVPAVIGIILLLSLSSLRLIADDFRTIGADDPNHYYYFVSDAEYEGYRWLRAHTTTQDVILANWFNGNLIPGVSARRVYVGHKAQTIRFDDKVNNINAFLLEKDDEKALQFLHENGITTIYLGNNDTMLQYGFKPQERSYLEKRFDQDGATIYSVTK